MQAFWFSGMIHQSLGYNFSVCFTHQHTKLRFNKRHSLNFGRPNWKSRNLKSECAVIVLASQSENVGKNLGALRHNIPFVQQVHKVIRTYVPSTVKLKLILYFCFSWDLAIWCKITGFVFSIRISWYCIFFQTEHTVSKQENISIPCFLYIWGFFHVFMWKNYQL